MRLLKVKAHRQESEATGAEDLLDIHGNDAADAAAKAGVTVHPRPSQHECREADMEWSFPTSLVAVAARLSSLWPPLRQQLGGSLVRVRDAQRTARARREPTPIPFQNRHHFVEHCGGRLILCSACLRRTRSWPAAHRLEQKERCSRVAQPLEEALGSTCRGHVLALGIFEDRATFICIRCGSYATAQLGGLSRQCGERPPTHGPESIRRFLRGYHPDGKHRRIVGDAFFRVMNGPSGKWLEQFTPQG